MNKIRSSRYNSTLHFLLPVFILFYCLPSAAAKIPDLEVPEVSTVHARSANQGSSQPSIQSFTHLNTTSLEVTGLDTTRPQKNNSTLRSVGLGTLSSDAPLSITTSQEISSRTSANKNNHDHSSKVSSLQSEGLGARIRAMAFMLVAILIPPIFVISLLFYKVHKRNKSDRRVRRHHHSHRHSWQA